MTNKLIVEYEGKRKTYEVKGPLFIHEKAPHKVVRSREGSEEKIDFEALPDARSVTVDAGVLSTSLSEVLWQNECALVLSDNELDCVEGEMGVSYMDGGEVKVSVGAYNIPELQEKLKNRSIRITIEVVPGGNL